MILFIALSVVGIIVGYFFAAKKKLNWIGKLSYILVGIALALSFTLIVGIILLFNPHAISTTFLGQEKIDLLPLNKSRCSIFLTAATRNSRDLYTFRSKTHSKTEKEVRQCRIIEEINSNAYLITITNEHTLLEKFSLWLSPKFIVRTRVDTIYELHIPKGSLIDLR